MSGCVSGRSARRGIKTAFHPLRTESPDVKSGLLTLRDTPTRLLVTYMQFASEAPGSLYTVSNMPTPSNDTLIPLA
jgi:hypothetical protein